MKTHCLITFLKFLLCDEVLTELSGGNNAVCHRPRAGSDYLCPVPRDPLLRQNPGKLLCPQAVFTVSGDVGWCDEMPDNPPLGSQHPDTGMSTPGQLTSSLVIHLSHCHQRCAEGHALKETYLYFPMRLNRTHNRALQRFGNTAA